MTIRSERARWWWAIPLGVAAITLLRFAIGSSHRNVRDDCRGGPGNDRLYFC
jgi:hypothetical protein